MGQRRRRPVYATPSSTENVTIDPTNIGHQGRLKNRKEQEELLGTGLMGLNQFFHNVIDKEFSGGFMGFNPVNNMAHSAISEHMLPYQNPDGVTQDMVDSTRKMIKDKAGSELGPEKAEYILDKFNDYIKKLTVYQEATKAETESKTPYDITDANMGYVTKEQLPPKVQGQFPAAMLKAKKKKMFVPEEEVVQFYVAEEEKYLDKARGAWTKAVAEGNDTKAKEIEDYVNFEKEKQKSFTTDTELTFKDQPHNKELTKSLRRRFGHKNLDGTIRTNEELIDLWTAEQHTLDFNTTALIMDATKVDELTPQQKADYLLQMETWEKVEGTGEGSQKFTDQALEIGGALLADPLTYIGVGTLGVGLATKETAKAVTKEVIKETLKASVKQHAKKFGTIGAIDGAVLGALHEGAKQTVKLKAKDLDVSENVDFGQVAKVSAIGTILGGTLGGLIGGGSKYVSNLLDVRKAEKGLTNKDIINELSEIVSEADAIVYYKELGISEDAIRRTIDDIHGEGIRFDTAKSRFVTAEGEDFKPRFILSSKDKPVKNPSREVKEEIIPLTPEQEATLTEYNLDLPTLDKIAEEELIQSNLKSVPNRAFDAPEKGLLFKVASDAVHSKYMANWTLGGDVIAAKVGARHIPERLRAVYANKERDLAQINGKLEPLFEATGLDKVGLESLLRNPKLANTPAKKKLVDMWQAAKRQQLKLLQKNKVITSKQANKFLSDVSYLPRVYDFRHLLGKEGSQEFADVLNRVRHTDKEMAEDMIRSITGNYTKEFVIPGGEWVGPAVRKILKQNRLHSEDSTGVVSSHIEKGRKIHGIAEEELDKFMVPPDARMSKFFDDVILRNELAAKFGAKNEVVKNTQKALERKGTQGKADAKAVNEYYYTAIGDASNSESLAALRSSRYTHGISRLNAFQNLKLTQAAIPNASQALVYGAAHLSNTTNTFNAILRSSQAIVKSIINSKETQELVRRAGVLGEMDMQRIMLENNVGGRIFDVELKGFLGPLDYLNDNTKFLRMVGFHGVESMNRRAGALMGATKAQMLHKKLQSKGFMSASLKKKKQVAKELKELGIENPYKKELTENDIANAGYFFNKDINFSGETMNIPESWHGPWGKLFTKFKSFSNYSARFMKRHVIDEMRRGNFTPAITMLTIGVPAGLAVEQTREYLNTFLFGNEHVAKENREALELVLTGLGQVGAFGVWTDVLKNAGGDSWAQQALLGPGVGQIADIGTGLIGDIILEGEVSEGLRKIGKTLTPNIPGKQQLFKKDKNKKKHKISY